MGLEWRGREYHQFLLALMERKGIERRRGHGQSQGVLISSLLTLGLERMGHQMHGAYANIGRCSCSLLGLRGCPLVNLAVQPHQAERSHEFFSLGI